MKRIFAFLFLTTSLMGLPQQARSETIYALATPNQIFSFDSATPGSISSVVTVTGLVTGTSLVGIDFRPAVPGQLVGVGVVGVTGTGNVYTINVLTGAATVVNTIPLISAPTFGVDFDPVSDALRIVSNFGQNLRIAEGGTGTVNTDGNLNLGIGGAAYANNVPGGVGGLTTLYDIDFNADTLVTQGSINGTPVSPNNGILIAVGSLGVNVSPTVGFDISGDSGTAFASLVPAGSMGSSLYTLNLSTGAATLVGPIASGNIPFGGLSVLPAPTGIPEPASLSLLSVGLLGLAGCRFLRRNERSCRWTLRVSGGV